MNNGRLALMALAIVLCAAVLTAATFVIRNDALEWSCAYVPGKPGPLQELAVKSETQDLRGFPKWFYRDPMHAGGDCQPPERLGYNIDVESYQASRFRTYAALQDFAFWGVVSAALIGTIVAFAGKGRGKAGK